MMKVRKRIIENMLSLGILQIANYALPLITLPYLVRVLGAEKFGLLSFAQAFIQYFIVLTDYGFNLSATRQISIHRHDKDEVSKIFSSVMLIKLALMLLSYLIMSATVLTIGKFRPDWIIYQATFLMVVGSVLFPIWFFQGMERMKYVTGLNLIAKTITTIAIFVFVRARTDCIEAALIQSAGFVIVGILGLASVRMVSPVKLVVPSLDRLKTVFVEGWHVFLAQIASTAFAPTSVFILGLFGSPQAVGYYSIAQKAVKAVIYLCIPVHTTIYPRVSQLFIQSRQAAFRFLYKATLFGGTAFLLMSIGLYVGADRATLLMTGHANGNIALLIRIMAILPFTIYLDNIIGTQIMLNTGMEKQFGSAVLYAAILSILMSFALVPKIGAIGSAIAFLSSQVFALLLMAFAVFRSKILFKLADHTDTAGYIIEEHSPSLAEAD